MENKTSKYVNPIKSIRIQNFKSLEDVKIDFSHLTFLFGPNSSGKSSFLKALLFLQKNLFPLNTGKTIYKINDNLDLGSYSSIVTNNDTKRNVIFEIEIQSSFWFPDIRIFDIDNENNYDFKKRLYEEECEGKIDTSIHNLNNKNIVELLQNHHASYGSDLDFGSTLTESNYHYKIVIKFSRKPKAQEIFIDFGTDYRLKKKSQVNLKGSSVSKNLESISFIDLNANSSLTLDTSKIYHYENHKPNFFKPSISLFNDKCLTELFSNLAIYKNNFNNLNEIPYHLPSFNIAVNFEKDHEAFPDIFTNKDYINIWRSYDKKTKIDKYYEVIKFYYLTYYYIPEELNNYLNTFHLPTVRELPKSKYLLTDGFFDPKEYYNFLNTLYAKQEEIKHFKQKFKKNEDIFKINESLKFLGFNSDLFIDKTTDIGRIILKHSNNRISNLIDESSGLLQFLPILISLYIAPAFNTILIEQPELHLHPKLQAELAKIFVDSRKNQIIETHSEHLIRKLQVLIAQGKIDKSEIIVYYFEKVDGISKLKVMEIDDRGLFFEDWPNGFFDDSNDLTLELFNAINTPSN